MQNHLSPRALRIDDLQPSQIVSDRDLAVPGSRRALADRGHSVRHFPLLTAAHSSETDGDHDGHADESECRVALPPPTSATACLLDQRLLLTQPLECRAVAAIANTRSGRARRSVKSHNTIIPMTIR